MSSNSLTTTGDEPADEPRAREDAAEPRRHHERTRRSQQAPLLTADDCRRMLAQQVKLTTTKFITPAQANANTRILQTLLTDAKSSAAVGPELALSDNLTTILRDSPDLLEFVEPLLSAEQLELILGGKDEDGQV